MVLPIRPANFPVAELAGTSLGQATQARGTSAATSASAVSPTATNATNAIPGDDGADFTAKLREALGEVNAGQVRAENLAADYASGKQNDIHGTMITMAQADVSLRLVANVRNRVIDAYREVMRMGS